MLTRRAELGRDGNQQPDCVEDSGSLSRLLVVAKDAAGNAADAPGFEYPGVRLEHSFIGQRHITE